MKKVLLAALGLYLLTATGFVPAAESEQDVDNFVFVGKNKGME